LLILEPVTDECPTGAGGFIIHELAVVPALAEQTAGILVGDRNYWSPTTTAEWHAYQVALLAPYRSAKRDPHPRWSARLSRVRYRINALGSPRFVVIRRVRKHDGFMLLSSPEFRQDHRRWRNGRRMSDTGRDERRWR
jgi:hypothetical protein